MPTAVPKLTPSMSAEQQIGALFANADKADRARAVAAAQRSPAALSPYQSAAEQIDELFARADAADRAKAAAAAKATAPDWVDRVASRAGNGFGPLAQTAVRTAGLAGRGLVETAQQLAGLPLDAAHAVYDLATSPQARAATLRSLAHPTTWLSMPSDAPTVRTSQMLSRYLPTPRTGPEKAAYTVENLLAGAALPMPVPGAGTVPANFIRGASSDPEAALGALEQQARTASGVSGLTKSQQAAAEGGRSLGMRLTPGQQSGSTPLMQLEARLESHPATAGPLARLKAANQTALNRVTAASIGERSDVVDANTLAHADDRLGKVFENVRNERPVTIDPRETEAALDFIDADNAGVLPNGMHSIREHPLVAQLGQLVHSSAEEPRGAETPELEESPPEQEGLEVKKIGMAGGPKWIVTRDFEPVLEPGAERPEYFDTEKEALAAIPRYAETSAPPLERETAHGESAPAVTAKQLGQLSSKLGKAAFKQMTSPSGDRDLGKALYEVKDYVDDRVQSALSPDEALDYSEARTQYRNLLNLARTGITNPASGDVSGAALARRLQSADRSGYLFGRNQSPMYRAARFAQAFKPIVGNSGTATRSAGHGLVSGLGLGVLGHLSGLPLGGDVALSVAPALGRVAANLGTRAYLTDPGAAIARAIFSGGPRTVGRLLTLPWRTLTPLALRGSAAGRVLGPTLNPALYGRSPALSLPPR